MWAKCMIHETIPNLTAVCAFDPVDGLYLLNTHKSYHWASTLGNYKENACKSWSLLDYYIWYYAASFSQTQSGWMKIIKYKSTLCMAE